MSDTDTRQLTPAQAAHLRRLWAAFEQAERELNDFAAYLLAEHKVEDPEAWQLSRDLTRLVRADRPGDSAD